MWKTTLISSKKTYTKVYQVQKIQSLVLRGIGVFVIKGKNPLFVWIFKFQDSNWLFCPKITILNSKKSLGKSLTILTKTMFILIDYAHFGCINLKKITLKQNFIFIHLKPKMGKNIFFGISMCNNFVGPHKDALYKNLSKFSKNSGFA